MDRYNLENTPAPMLAAGYARLPAIASAMCVHHATVYRRMRDGDYGPPETLGHAIYVRISKVLEALGDDSVTARERLIELARQTRAAAIAGGATPVQGEFARCGLTSET